MSHFTGEEAKSTVFSSHTLWYQTNLPLRHLDSKSQAFSTPLGTYNHSSVSIAGVMTFLFMLEMESSGKIAGWGWGMFVVILARNRICFATFCVLTAGSGGGRNFLVSLSVTIFHNSSSSLEFFFIYSWAHSPPWLNERPLLQGWIWRSWITQVARLVFLSVTSRNWFPRRHSLYNSSELTNKLVCANTPTPPSSFISLWTKNNSFKLSG